MANVKLNCSENPSVAINASLGFREQTVGQVLIRSSTSQTNSINAGKLLLQQILK